MAPTISVIVPCYNQGLYLAEALESIVAQTYTQWECIIVNDGSVDNTAEVAILYCKLDRRFKYIFKENGGVASARNAGIAAASGVYILPLDADDKIGRQYLDLAVDVFDKFPRVKVVYCQAEYFGTKTGPWLLPEPDINSLLLDNMIFCSALFKKAEFDRIGGYNLSLVHGLEDWDFWIKLLRSNDEIIRLNSVQFYYRQQSVSRSSTVAEDEHKAIITRAGIYNANLELYLERFGDPIIVYKSYIKHRNELNLIKQSNTYKVLSIIGKVKKFFTL